MELQRHKPLFEKNVSITVKNTLKNSIILRILSGSRTNNEFIYYFELTDENDPYFLYYFEISEKEFSKFRHDRKILVDFHVFPQKFIHMIELCLASTGSPSASPTPPTSFFQPDIYSTPLNDKVEKKFTPLPSSTPLSTAAFFSPSGSSSINSIVVGLVGDNFAGPHYPTSPIHPSASPYIISTPSSYPTTTQTPSPTLLPPGVTYSIHLSSESDFPCLEIVQTNIFNIIPQLSLPLVKGTDELIKLNLANRLSLSNFHNKSLLGNIGQLTEKISSLESQRDTLTEKNNTYMKESISNNEKISTLTSQNLFLNNNVLELTNSMKSLNEKNSELNSKINELTINIYDLNQTNSKHLLTNTELNKKNSGLETNIEKLKKLNEKSNTNLETLKEQFNTLQLSNGELTTDLNNLTSLHHSLELLNQKYVDDNKNLIIKFDEIVNKNQALQLKLNEKNEISLTNKNLLDEKLILIENNNTLIVKIKSLESIIKENELQKHDFELKYKSLEFENQRNKNEIENLNKIVSDLEKKLKLSAERIEESNKTIEDDKNIISLLTQDLNRWQSGLNQDSASFHPSSSSSSHSLYTSSNSFPPKSPFSSIITSQSLNISSIIPHNSPPLGINSLTTPSKPSISYKNNSNNSNQPSSHNSIYSTPINPNLTFNSTSYISNSKLEKNNLPKDILKGIETLQMTDEIELLTELLNDSDLST